jgi:hypothetical protein
VDESTPRDDEPSSARPSPADEPSPEGEETSSTPGKPVDQPTEESDESPVSEPPGSDAEPPKKQRRSNEFWLATLGIAGTLLAAIAGGAATIASGVEHDNHDTKSAQVSFAHESQSAQTSFARTQQVAAYTGFVNSAGDLTQSLLYERNEDVNRYPYIAQRESLTPNSDREKSSYDFDHAFYEVSLFGSPRARDAADKAREISGRFSIYLITWEFEHPATAGTPSCRAVVLFLNNTDDLLMKLGAAIGRFQDVAREDLGIPSIPPISESNGPVISRDPDDWCRAWALQH